MNLFKRLIIPAYEALWRTSIPLLRVNPRLRQGAPGRMSHAYLPCADLWIQAASAGEAYLAVTLVRLFRPPCAMNVLITTTTAQGMDILAPARTDDRKSPFLTVKTAWFPFDRPELMDRAVETVSPRAMVLLETELWPGLLWALKNRRIPVLMINARMSARSFSCYMKTWWLWRPLSPDVILAISRTDADRFSALFDRAIVREMSNIKYDAILPENPDPDATAVSDLLPGSTPLTILASIRMKEEPEAEKLLEAILKGFPEQVVALFPRHMHRILHWKDRLSTLGFTWQLRSETRQKIRPGTVLLWDTFGELRSAYSLASVAFVGGSLKPLGGQNFVEPVVCGTPTVTGPYLDDFSWVDPAIFTTCSATRVENWKQAAEAILEALRFPPDKNLLKDRGRRFIISKQGGTDSACNLIIETLFNNPRGMKKNP
ncbi:MAG: glycosyltransferase N-terminal domain-containing protein [Pseudomonadota bacterium]